MSQKVICKHCGEEFDIRGIRLHEKTCKANKDNQEENESHKAKTDKRGGKREKRNKIKHICPDCGNDELRLLNQKDEIENHLMKQGWSYVCDECKEVLK